MHITQASGSSVPLRCLALVGLFYVSCGDGASRDVAPTPPGGLAPVTLGELVQLHLAVDGFDSVFEGRSEEQDILPLLVHAWATFYHRPDPPPTAEARYAFTESLCRARFPKEKEPRSLFRCMDQLRESLLEDLLWVTTIYRRAGRTISVGELRLRDLEKAFERQRRFFKVASKERTSRRESLSLPTVTSCAIEQPRCPVLALSTKGAHLNGFPVLSEHNGRPEKDASTFDHLSGLLESRLLESARQTETETSTAGAAQLVVAVDGRLTVDLLLGSLGVAGTLGVQKICLKVERLGSFRVPCCVTLRLAPRGVVTTRHLELTPEGLFLVLGTGREQLATGGILPPESPRSIRLRPGTRVANLVSLLGRFTPGTGAEPEVLLEKVSPGGSGTTHTETPGSSRKELPSSPLREPPALPSLRPGAGVPSEDRP